MMGIGGQMATPSGVRTFTGYDYASKTGGETVRLYSVGTLYNDGAIASSYIKRLAEVVSDDGDVIKSIWLKDPTYTGTVDYNSADTTGFIKVMETSVMSPGTYNTSLVVPTNSIINATESAQITANAQAGKRDNDIFVTVYEDNYLSIRILRSLRVTVMHQVFWFKLFSKQLIQIIIRILLQLIRTLKE